MSGTFSRTGSGMEDRQDDSPLHVTRQNSKYMRKNERTVNDCENGSGVKQAAAAIVIQYESSVRDTQRYPARLLISELIIDK
ncbi:hypothetical protein QTP88_006852 [Uroleucon formosanum]